MHGFQMCSILTESLQEGLRVFANLCVRGVQNFTQEVFARESPESQGKRIQTALPLTVWAERLHQKEQPAVVLAPVGAIE